MKSRIRITPDRKPFDPDAFAEVLVAAVLSQLAEESKQAASDQQEEDRERSQRNA